MVIARQIRQKSNAVFLPGDGSSEEKVDDEF